VLTIVVSLTSLLLWQGAANASRALKSGNEVTVWMKPDANAQEIHAVGTRPTCPPRTGARWWNWPTPTRSSAR
jgi:hypothetical protein